MNEKRENLIVEIKQAVANLKTINDVLQVSIKMIDSFSDGYNWTGYYMLHGEHLEVGPYIGAETPHTKIELNSGICGAAVSQQKSIVVDDVHADPRFLACSISTKSEIVIPLMDGDNCLGEIDIDSNKPAFFTKDDKFMLEQIADIVVSKLKSLSK